jgi:hypothetical protein
MPSTATQTSPAAVKVDDHPAQGAQQPNALHFLCAGAELLYHAEAEGAQKQILHHIPGLMFITAAQAGKIHQAGLVAAIQVITGVIAPGAC